MPKLTDQEPLKAYHVRGRLAVVLERSAGEAVAALNRGEEYLRRISEMAARGEKPTSIMYDPTVSTPTTALAERVERRRITS